MAVKNKGLGKGLGSLLGEMADIGVRTKENPKEEAKTAETLVKTRLVEPNREQPRKAFDDAELQELAESIRVHGVIQPLIVTKDGEHFRIVAGERRWRAAKIAGLKEIPVIIREYSEQTMQEVALIENIQRKDLNPIEEAEAFQKLIEDYALTQEELAERVSKSRTAITNAVRLLKLPKKVREMLQAGTLSVGHAKVLLGLSEEKDQNALAERVLAENLSVRETEKAVKAINRGPRKEKAPLRNSVAYEETEDNLQKILGTKVVIKRKSDNAGRIEIDFYSLEDIERILKHIK